MNAVSTAPRARGSAATYTLPVLALVVAVAARWLLDPLLGDTLPLVTLFGAVAAAIWVSTIGAAVVVTVAGYLAAAYLFIEPRGELGLDVATNLAGAAAYAFTCALIIAFGEWARAARVRETESRELLRVTLLSIGDAVVTTDADGRVTYLNTVAESLTGWSQSEAAGKPLDTVFRIVNETTRLPVDNPATRALREGVVVGLANHTILIRQDGTECPIDDSAAPIRDEEGRVSGCVLIFRDVSAQRRLERDREQQLFVAQRLASIVESSELAIISKGLDGIVRSWNTAAERLFGHTAEQAIGRHISLVIPRERLAEEDRIIATLRAGGRIDHLETERVRADGQRILVSLTVSPIKDDQGNVVGASKIVRDITLERAAEAERARLTAELAAADERKSAFLATLAHELRGPLAPLGNVLEIWKRSANAEDTRRAQQTMERQLGQLVRLVDDLLDMNRITHNRLELRKARVELAPVLEHALETCRPMAAARGHDLVVSLPAEPCYVHADAARLAQVFSNLLSNSCKYTDEGGTISLTAECEPEDVVVSVKDTGVGIPPDKLERVFDMFSQVDASRDRAEGGLGIGLTLVKQLVGMHGGSVEARSAGPGMGSEFVVRLPLDRTAAQPADVAPAPAAMRKPHESRRVLVVDDNVDSAVSMTTLLELEGHEAAAVHDGAAAIDAVQSYRPDVVLLDIGLPGMSGHEVCRRLRALPRGDELFVVAITGWGQDSDRQRSWDAGFDDHLVKPVKYDTLAALLSARKAAAARRAPLS